MKPAWSWQPVPSHGEDMKRQGELILNLAHGGSHSEQRTTAKKPPKIE